MFAIGQAKIEVDFSKLELPKEYRLTKKKILGVWTGERTLYLSDEAEALKLKAGKNGELFEPNIDSSSRIHVPSSFHKKKATIKGCISTIKIEFEL